MEARPVATHFALSLAGSGADGMHLLLRNLLRPEVAWHSLEVRVLDAQWHAQPRASSSPDRIQLPGPFDFYHPGARAERPVHRLSRRSCAVKKRTRSFTGSPVT